MEINLLQDQIDSDFIDNHAASPAARNFQWPRERSDGSTDDTPCVEGITWADPQLGALADNGGPTLTAMPTAGSVVVGAGIDCPGTDQRGQPRNPASCATGAVET